MSKATTSAKKNEPAQVKSATKRRWYFPTLGKSVDAASESEALKQVQSEVKKGSAQEEGDGNI